MKPGITDFVSGKIRSRRSGHSLEFNSESDIREKPTRLGFQVENSEIVVVQQESSFEQEPSFNLSFLLKVSIKVERRNQNKRFQQCRMTSSV